MSVVDDLTALGIKKEDINLLINDHIKFDCGPLVYRTIIHWGFAKTDGIIIRDHFDHMKILEKNKVKYKGNLKKWVDRNETKLQKCSFSEFDITALHDFLPILCHDKIAQTFTSEYDGQMKDPNSVESLLHEIKDFRNEVSHEYAEAVKDSHIDKMRATMLKCIRTAGSLYGKDLTEIDEKVKVLDDEFNKVLLNTSHFYENRVKFIAKKITSEVPSNMLERYAPYFSVPLPGSSKKLDASDIVQYSTLSVTTDGQKVKEDKHSKNLFPCTEIFNNTHEKYIVINGGPGSGKTILMRNMCQDILQTSVHGSKVKFKKIEQFKIPIYLECRSEQQTNLAKFLRECLKDFLSPEDDIYEAFKMVKGLVFLIDGYDEINNNCRQLVDSIIDFCRDNNASCIVSSRVEAGNNFVSELQRKNLNYTTMFIEPISRMSDKVNFMRSYAGKMDGSIDTDKLVNSFEKLTEAAKEVFSSPILLALFLSLFVHDPDSVSNMKNEHSAYESVRTSFVRDMMEKLKTAPNPRGRAEDVAYILGKFCLKLFRAKKYFLEGKDYYDIIAECEKISGMPKHVSIPSLLSCILTPEHSLKYLHDTTYQFMHSTIQEFFAAKYISENIRELQDDKSTQSLSEDRQLSKIFQLLELDESQSYIEGEMYRYGNIIKHLMLETLDNGELSKYSNTFTLLLKKNCEQDKYYVSSDYYFDLILSSDTNADMISIVSDCRRGWNSYNCVYNRHIKPMTEVVQKMKPGFNISIFLNFDQVTNTQQIIQLLKVLGNKSQIYLHFGYSYENYQPLEGEFYTQLKKSNIRGKVTAFKACITSGEHLSIVVRALRCYRLEITTPSVSNINFAALEEHKGFLHLRIKYTDDCLSTGSNPVTEGTFLWGTKLRIDHIPADGRENVYKIIKYICPKSKKFWRIEFYYCHLTDTDANELLRQLEGEKIRTCGEKTETKQWRVHSDKSRLLQLRLKENEEDKREKEKGKQKKNEKKRREKESRENDKRAMEYRVKVKREGKRKTGKE